MSMDISVFLRYNTQRSSLASMNAPSMECDHLVLWRKEPPRDTDDFIHSHHPLSPENSTWATRARAAWACARAAARRAQLLSQTGPRVWGCGPHASASQDDLCRFPPRWHQADSPEEPWELRPPSLYLQTTASLSGQWPAAF